MLDIAKIINRLRLEFRIGSIVFDNKLRLDDTVFLSSMGRSGSTILSNVINYDNSCRIMFEPFRNNLVSEAKNFVYPLYLSPDNSERHYFDAAHKIFSGKVHSKWIDRENKTIFPQRRIIKGIRTNLFLKWIYNNFTDMKIILLVRHPCAVASSWFAAGFRDCLEERDKLLANSTFVNVMDDFILKEYAKVDSSFESVIFFWCILYSIPFQEFNEDEILVVFYEDLMTDPRNELKSLFSFLDRDYLEKEVLSVLSEPSFTTSKKKKNFRNGEVKINGWQKKFSSEQIDRAYEIMSYFGMERLYSRETSVPNKEVLKELFNGPRKS